MKTARATLLVILAAGTLAAASAPALAAGEGPGWQLLASSYPSNLVQGVDEVQEVAASAETGTFTLAYKGAETLPIPVHATDAEVQAALGVLSTVGQGNVAVTGSNPGKYQIEFTKALGKIRVAELEATGATSAVKTEGTASGTIGIDVFNIGAAASKGTITVTDVLPQGVKAKEAGELITPSASESEEDFGIYPRIAQGVWDCTGNGEGPEPNKIAGATVVTCTNDPTTLEVFAGGGGTPTFKRNENNHPQPAVGIAVEVEQGAPEGAKVNAGGNHVTIAGGGASEAASTTNPITIGPIPAQQGLTQADAWFSNADGTIDRQAGSHPYTATFIFGVATGLNAKKEGYLPGGEIRDLETQVPPGFIGDLHATAQCTRNQLFVQECPPASMVGRLKVQTVPGFAIEEQVFNMVPEPGTPAELGFEYSHVPVYVTFNVKSGSNYAIVARVNNIPQRLAYQSILTLWGVPSESSHDIWRHGTSGCSEEELEGPALNGNAINYCARQVAPAVKPFLRLPTSCEEKTPQVVFRELHGWQQPNATSEAASFLHDANDRSAAFTGCEKIGTAPGLTTSPDTARADSPAGFTADVTPPLGGFEIAGDLSPADIQNTTVTLPEGFVVNPGQAAGLQSCPAGRPGPGQYGDALTTVDEKNQNTEDTEPASCPQASKVGTVMIKSPLIEADAEKQLEGNVYVLSSNPPEVKLLVAASADGVNLKLIGTVHLNEQTGRLVTTFEGTPQLPFSDLKLSFEGGVRAALATPTRCGSNVTDADFMPWSAPAAQDWLQTAAFTIAEGPNGTPCPGSPLPFAPTLSAGSASDQAGGFTNFTTQLQRGDGQQRIEKFQFKAPAGLAGMISSVPLCAEPMAQQGTCAPSSQIGRAAVMAGPGSNPLVIPQPGEPAPAIYLTGPYRGAPFGLSIVTQAVAGPFNLGTIVTRAKIEIDPSSAQVTITTDPLPQIVKGVPTDLRSVEAVIDRPGFIFNPTNCAETAISGSATGTGPPGVTEPSVSAPLLSRFQTGSCRSLGFAPKVSVSTGAHASKNNGQSLSFKISYPKSAMGTEAWFKEAKFDIPKQLPAEDRTLQQACLAATFEANRAACPKHSKIGSAIVHTPVLPVPLEGSVYFVSHGGAKFPDVVMTLSGDNVNIVLTGETLIRNGVTSATFRSLPDVPFESIEVKLPTGEYSEFGGYTSASNHYDFCGQKLTVPTFLKAQNGLEIRRRIPLAIQGCGTKVSLSSQATKASTLTASVYVPAAGKLKAGGKGLSTVTRRAHGQELVTLVLRASRGGSFRTKLNLFFIPSKGRRQRVAVSVRA